MAMAYASQYGLKRIIKLCFGVGAGFFAIIVLCSFFNILLVRFMPMIELPLTIFGVGYMLYLAFKILTSQGYRIEWSGNYA